MPTFEKSFEIFKHPFKNMFENHISKKGFDVNEFWKKIDDAIVQIGINSESKVLQKVGYDNINLKPFLTI